MGMALRPDLAEPERLEKKTIPLASLGKDPREHASVAHGQAVIEKNVMMTARELVRIVELLPPSSDLSDMNGFSACWNPDVMFRKRWVIITIHIRILIFTRAIRIGSRVRMGLDHHRIRSLRMEDFLKLLQERYEAHGYRHEQIPWTEVSQRLTQNPRKLDVLMEMERTGGEPDVIGRDETTGCIVFCDCAPESPLGRRSLCYDPEALASRKANKPVDSALGMADDMGLDLLTEAQYKELQELERFDQKTSSWVRTPPDMRALGGALFCDRRYGRIFTYHNGAESYYSSRGFRGRLEV